MRSIAIRQLPILISTLLAFTACMGCFDHGGSTLRYADVTGAKASVDGNVSNGSKIADAIAHKQKLASDFRMAGMLFETRCASYSLDVSGIHIESLRVSNARHRSKRTRSATFYIRNESNGPVYVDPYRFAFGSSSYGNSRYRMEFTRGEEYSVTWSHEPTGEVRLVFKDVDTGAVTTETRANADRLPEQWVSLLQLPANQAAIVSVVFFDLSLEDGVVRLVINGQKAPVEAEFSFRQNDIKLP